MTTMTDLDHTHDPALRSWVDSANTPETDFPIQNLPLGMFRRAGSTGSFRPGTAIGDQVLDLIAAAELGVLSDGVGAVLRTCEGLGLNPLMAVGPALRRQLRHELVAALNADAGPVQSKTLADALVPAADVELTLPCRIGDYTDFYAGIHHATTVGKLFRPDNPLLPNYKWVPIGYHGRVSSIGVSGQTFRRPVGQTKAPDAEVPSVGPIKRLDYELEVGALVGTGERARSSDRDRGRRAASVRSRAAERLVGAGHPGLGVPAAGALPVQELRDDAVAVGDHDGSAGAVPARVHAARG